MKNTETTNGITMQDEFVATVSRVPLTNRNYYVVVSKASQKLCKSLMSLGFDLNTAEKMVSDAYDMVALNQAVRG